MLTVGKGSLRNTSGIRGVEVEATLGKQGPAEHRCVFPTFLFFSFIVKIFFPCSFSFLKTEESIEISHPCFGRIFIVFSVLCVSYDTKIGNGRENGRKEFFFQYKERKEKENNEKSDPQHRWKSLIPLYMEKKTGQQAKVKKQTVMCESLFAKNVLFFCATLPLFTFFLCSVQPSPLH